MTLGQSGGTTAFTGGVTATVPSGITISGTISAAGSGIIDLGTPVTVADSALVGGTSTGQITLGNATLASGATLTVGAGQPTRSRWER